MSFYQSCPPSYTHTFRIDRRKENHCARVDFEDLAHSICYATYLIDVQTSYFAMDEMAKVLSREPITAVAPA